MLILFSLASANLRWFVTRSRIASFYDTSNTKQSDQQSKKIDQHYT